MLSQFKPAVERPLQPFVKTFKNVDPNLISLGGLIFPVVFFALVVNGYYGWALAVFILLVVDILDGMIARTHNKVTAFGGFLDSTIDRFADFMVIAAFSFGNLVSWGLVFALLLPTYLISYIRSRTELASEKKLVANVGLIERTERLVFIFITLALYAIFPDARFYDYNIPTVAFFILIVLSAITVAQRVSFARKKL